MECYHCGTKLIWKNADHDIEDNEDYVIVTHLSCPNCDVVFSKVEVYLPEGKKNGQNKS